MSVSCQCCAMTGNGVCDRPIPRLGRPTVCLCVRTVFTITLYTYDEQEERRQNTKERKNEKNDNILSHLRI